MIIEGLCTTQNDDGTINVAPMGPIVDDALSEFRFRPFQSSTTYANLKARGCGVFHVTDDVELIVRAAIGRLTSPPLTFPAQRIAGQVLASACRWYEFEVTSIDDSQERTEIQTRLLHQGRLRDFFGFNRAKHAVLELAILATRLHLLAAEDIRASMARLRVPVDKTAGAQEQMAFDLLCEFISGRIQSDASP